MFPTHANMCAKIKRRWQWQLGRPAPSTEEPHTRIGTYVHATLFFSRAMTSRDPHYVAKSAHLFLPFLRACVPPPSDTPAVSASAGERKQTALCLPASAVNVIQSPLRNNHERNRSQAANIATKQTRFAEVRRAAPTVRLNDKRYMAAT